MLPEVGSQGEDTSREVRDTLLTQKVKSPLSSGDGQAGVQIGKEEIDSGCQAKPGSVPVALPISLHWLFEPLPALSYCYR